MTASKVCTACRVALPLEAFSPSARGGQGVKATCRPCRRTHEKTTYLATIAGRKAAIIKWKYRLSADDHEARLVEQEGLCAICRDPQRDRLAVDHDHACCGGERSCGRCVRGLLCQRCNGMLAFVENERLLTSALKYLAKWSDARGALPEEGPTSARNPRTPRP